MGLPESLRKSRRGSRSCVKSHVLYEKMKRGCSDDRIL